MAKDSIIWGVILLGCTIQALSSFTEDSPVEYMSREERETLKEEARDMFYHAYNAYMDNAYPADELMPLSCKGRYRGSEPDRGDIDSTLGNFSLTLVDTLDTLVVLGDLGEFENAVRLVVNEVTFDTDVIVSLFETNIRMLGGLLSGHILAEYLQLRADIMPWYRGELLNLAKDLGYRFLPAFNTTTGIPFGRINLQHGMKGVPAEMCRETCTACAGSMILEMAALSRLTGESIFEDKAQKAMDALWRMRHRGTDLMGSVLNVHSGDWVRRDSGVGAGIDSYYEYCLKAYILLGDEKYLGRFNKHYQAVMKYVSQGPMLLDVHMHRPNTNSKNFMDALLAFWPGLQVLKGDIKPAVETHEMLYQVMQRHNFIPEAFTTDFQVHWGHHPLRPEFLESTYFLYRATGDHYYLGVGRKVLKSLQTYARVPCGYAAVSDVRTNKHDDTMDSFVLSETFKYLFLLFAEPSELVLDLDEFIFTTEGHLLPLTLAAVRTNVTTDFDRDAVHVNELDRTCPNSLHLFPASVRQPLRNMVEDVCPRRTLKRRLNASQFQANNLEHLKILSNMGITILTLADGRVQLLHTFSNARTGQDAEEGLLFMQEMVELSRKQSQQSETRPQSVSYIKPGTTPPEEVTLLAGPAHFGPGLKDGNKVTGKIELANPPEACGTLIEPEKLVGKIVMVSRGNCMFVEKARRIGQAGAIAGIVLDTVVGSSAALSPMFAMSGDEKEPDDVTIPVVFLFNNEANELVAARVASGNSLIVTIGDYTPQDEIQLKAPGDLSVFERLKGSLKDFLTRQITPQNTASGIPVVSPTTTNVGSKTEQDLVVEYGNLKAILFKDTDMVKVVTTDATPVHRTFRLITNIFEKIWLDDKLAALTLIYADKFEIPIVKIQFQYQIINKQRRLEGIFKPVEKFSMPVLLRWFLKELNDADSHPSIGNDVDMFQTSEDNDSEELLKQVKLLKSLKADTSHSVIQEKTTNEEFNELNADLQQVRKQIDSTDETFKLLSAFDEEVHTYFKMLKIRKFAELGMIFKFPTNNKVNTGNTAEGTTEHPIVVEYEHLKATAYVGMGFVKIETTDAAPATHNPSQSLTGLEEEWASFKQFILNVMYSRTEPAIEIAIKELYMQCKIIRIIHGITFKDVELRNIVLWYLQELAAVRTNQAMVEAFHLTRKTVESTCEKDPTSLLCRSFEDRKIWDSDLHESIHIQSMHLNSKLQQDNLIIVEEDSEKSDHLKKDTSTEVNPNENSKNSATKVNDDIESFILAEIEKSAPSLMTSETAAEKNESDRSTENIDLNKIHLEKELIQDGQLIEDRKDAEVRERNEATKVFKAINDHDTDTRKSEASSKDEAIDFLEEMHKEDQSKRINIKDDKKQASDPLEEFKKPVWAPDERKEGTTKTFSQFQRKPNDRNFEYQAKYSLGTKNHEKNTRQNDKRIEDEL